MTWFPMTGLTECFLLFVGTKSIQEFLSKSMQKSSGKSLEICKSKKSCFSGRKFITLTVCIMYDSSNVKTMKKVIQNSKLTIFYS